MSARLEDLEPWTRARAERLIAGMARVGDPIRITQGLRTDDEQNHYFAKGRTMPGEPCHHSDGVRPVGKCAQHPLGATVTRARAGESPHNEVIEGMSAAFDVCFVKNGPYPDPETPEGEARWQLLGKMGEQLGLNWGGPRGEGDRFTFDRPHFERPDWKTVKRQGAAA